MLRYHNSFVLKVSLVDDEGNITGELLISKAPVDPDEDNDFDDSDGDDDDDL